MGGQDKPTLEVGGMSMRVRVLGAARTALGPEAPLVLVGADGPDLDLVPGPLTCVREEPPFAGPVAGLERGLRALEPVEHTTVLLLGGDMPRLRPDVLATLTDAGPADSVRTLRDASGHVQFLCAAWPAALLRGSLEQIRHPETGWESLSLKRLYATLGDRLHVCEAVAATAACDQLADVDDPAELRRVRREFAALENSPSPSPTPNSPLNPS